jgi:hypothetical protein
MVVGTGRHMGTVLRAAEAAAAAAAGLGEAAVSVLAGDVAALSSSLGIGTGLFGMGLAFGAADRDAVASFFVAGIAGRAVEMSSV